MVKSTKGYYRPFCGSGICDGRASKFLRLVTNADCCFIIEDKICRLITNLQPKQKQNKSLLSIALPSSPALQSKEVDEINRQLIEGRYGNENFCNCKKRTKPKKFFKWQ